ncbi:MAG: DNA adenine methylase [Planctomycetia bacterium]|nr:DNA adenine methylase [Planctomycetia bacterium]
MIGGNFYFFVATFINTATVHLSSVDYAQVLETLPRGTFVYLDPPYDPVSDTASFAGYTKGGFSREDQIRLREYCDILTACIEEDEDESLF